jgi:hypothetical protein
LETKKKEIMPINPTTLKASIDTQITNETVDFAITPSEVGGRMKDCVDYTTEQAALKENLITATTSAQYYRGDKTFATLNKAAVNLANVDNTSDVNKPISTATQVALDLKEDLINPTTSAQYYRGDKTFATLNKAAVNLASVDNTSDANKPISIATQTALNSKQNTLVSGTNIKTINGTSVLGSGDLTVSGSSDIKVLKTVITSAEVLNIFTTPKVIVPAIAGKIIVPTNIVIVINYNSSTYSDVGGSWKIKFESEATNIATTTSFLGSATFDKQSIQTLFYTSFTTSSDFINSSIVLSTTGNNPAGGNSGITVYVTYSEITL